jgi:D-glycero-D-manno-heptose 1,7-bisphosphate phosphatase
MPRSGDSLSLKRAVFLDRDGVINEVNLKNNRPFPPAKLTELRVLPGVSGALEKLRNRDFEIVVITNQPDIARGFANKAHVDEINNALTGLLDIKYFYVCAHDDGDNCDCRKPKPGLITRAAADLRINLAESFVVGDRWRDISAGQAAGCTCFFIDYSYDEIPPTAPYLSVKSLSEAVELIVREFDARID